MLGIDIFKPRKKAPNDKPRLIGRKPPLKLKEIWAIRVNLHVSGRRRDLALFNLAINSKLRACDLVTLRVQDVCQPGQVAARASVIQQKTKRPVQFEITEQARTAVMARINQSRLTGPDYLFPSRIKCSPHLSTRQYARIVKDRKDLACRDWPRSPSVRNTLVATH